jgi:hypothetical protein
LIQSAGSIDGALLSYVRVSSGAQPLGEILADKKAAFTRSAAKRNDVGVDGEELGVLDPDATESGDTVAPAPAAADDHYAQIVWRAPAL